MGRVRRRGSVLAQNSVPGVEHFFLSSFLHNNDDSNDDDTKNINDDEANSYISEQQQ